ncbi:DEAD/DEAH box helicase [Qipengyuania sp. 1NDW9]|uniref:helicase-related protein n=1 Tax=Qipengyuania xiapuensis TaxID=2867236 RepID=UPI001C88D75F|nr:helicase-related protein [Qipengyuania xiapuensis]MBX7492043.1 DEAD/DEAH box helicase [Qipengyuania xiapuensis]
MFAPGTRVRLRNRPAEIGTVTDTEAVETHGRTFIEIEFPHGRELKSVVQLEEVVTAPDALEDLKAGKLSSPQSLRRALTHVRMTSQHLADIIYSIGATNTEFHAYQYKPVLKLLNSPSRGLLVADEVGLGKTIEAGLIWTELVARGDARRLLVVCPKSLREKWRAELRSKFNVEAKLCDAEELLFDLKEGEFGKKNFAYVASLSGLKPNKGWEEVLDPKPGSRDALAHYLNNATRDLFDLVIFDEAHHLRNRTTQNHELAELLSDVASYKVFLSATPINLHTEDLRSLLNLIDEDTFGNEFLFPQLLSENEPIIAAWEAARNPSVPMDQVRALVDKIRPGLVLQTGGRLKRLKAELAKTDAFDDSNRVKLAARIEEMSLLGTTVNRTRRRDVADFKVQRRPKTLSWEMAPDTERAFYDRATEVIEEYAEWNDINARFLLAQTQRLLASSLAAAYRHWGEGSGSLSLDEDVDIDADAMRKIGPLITELGAICDDPDELQELERADSKYEKLKRWLREMQNESPDEKIIIFSSFRRTLSYLAKRLTEDGFASIELHGGISAPRQETVDRFADAPGGTVLLTSEVGGEGLDLQFCRVLVNWDLPWNPMKVEQRIGRIDRIGQKAEAIDIKNLIAKNTIEEQVYERLYLRLNLIQQTLGDFEPILGEMVDKIDKILSDPKLTKEERDRELERASTAAATRREEEEKLEKEAPGLIGLGDSILQQINDAQAPHKRLKPEDLFDYITGVLIDEYPGTRFDRANHEELDLYDIRLSPQLAIEFARFKERFSSQFPTNFDSNSKVVRAIFGSSPDRFTHRGIDTIAMTHPLARFAASRMSEKELSTPARPVTAFSAPGEQTKDLNPGQYLVAVQSWAIKGLNPVDRLVFSALHMASGELLNDERAEQLTMESIVAEPRLRRLREDEIQLAARLADETLMPHLARQLKEFREAETAKHFDQVGTQKALIEAHREREIEKAERQIRDHQLSGSAKRQQLVYAVRATRDKTLARLDDKLKTITAQEDDITLKDPVTVGMCVIEVGGQN